MNREEQKPCLTAEYFIVTLAMILKKRSENPKPISL